MMHFTHVAARIHVCVCDESNKIVCSKQQQLSVSFWTICWNLSRQIYLGQLLYLTPLQKTTG